MEWMRPIRPVLIARNLYLRLAGHSRTFFKPAQCMLPPTPEASLAATLTLPVIRTSKCYPDGMYAQEFQVDVLIRGERRPCPLEWLDQFSMRNFTNSADFDDTLPLADGRLEASFRLTPERFAEGLSAWLTQRGKGEGQPVQVEVKLL
jgi:hypothetical protein